MNPAAAGLHTPKSKRPAVNLLWGTRMASTLSGLYSDTLHCKKNPHPASGTSSIPCPVAFIHTACTEGQSTSSFKSQDAVPWGGRAGWQISWQVSKLARYAGVSKQPRPAIYLLLTPACHLCKSSISQCFGPQPWTRMQWPASHGAKSIPQACEILSQLTDTATTAAPLQSALWHPDQPRTAAVGRLLLLSHYICGRFEKSVVPVPCPQLTEAQQLKG